MFLVGTTFPTLRSCHLTEADVFQTITKNGDATVSATKVLGMETRINWAATGTDVVNVPDDTIIDDWGRKELEVFEV